MTDEKKEKPVTNGRGMVMVPFYRYNPITHSQPQIARVDFKLVGYDRYQWGLSIGQPDCGGKLFIDAADGDIITIEQRRYKDNEVISEWYKIEDGECIKLSGKDEAYRLSTQKPTIYNN